MGIGTALLLVPFLFAFSIYCLGWYGLFLDIILFGVVYSLFSDNGFAFITIGKLGIGLVLLIQAVKFMDRTFGEKK